MEAYACKTVQDGRDSQGGLRAAHLTGPTLQWRGGGGGMKVPSNLLQNVVV
jgi:hypothetical protein